MICPECAKGDTTSRVTIGVSTSTCMAGNAYYDETGAYHNHDANIFTQEYACSNGHRFSRESRSSCPSCEWGSR